MLLLLSKLQTGTTALFFAAQGGYAEIVAVLVEEGAAIDSCSIVSTNLPIRTERLEEFRDSSVQNN